MEFFVPGVPVAQGSKRHVGRGILVESAKQLGPWREAVINAALNVLTQEVFFGPVRLQLVFRFPRPKTHYGTGRNAELLKTSAPRFKTSAPDLDKLVRAVGDALTMAGVLRDDALIASLVAVKIYDDHPGVKVVITNA
jgi:crossover junction endodeoxyribonuclease RusA